MAEERLDSVQRTEDVEVGRKSGRLDEERRWQLRFVSLFASCSRVEHLDLPGSLKISDSGTGRLEDGGKLHSGRSDGGGLKTRGCCS